MRKFSSSTRKEELKKMKDAYIRLRNFSIVQLGFCVAALITALLKAMLPSVLCLLAMVLFRFTLHRKAAAKYQQSITDASLACSVGPKLDQFELCEKGGTGITREDITAAELLPVLNDASGAIGFYQGISGSCKDVELSLNDTTIPIRSSSGDKGNTVLCGVWMHFSLQKDTGRNFRILSKELLPDNLRKEFFKTLPALRARDAAKAGFQEKLYIYDESPASEEDPGFLPLSVSFTSAVDRLFRKASGNPAISVQGSTVNIFIKDRILAPNYRVNTQPNENFLKLDPVPEFRDALEVVKAL